MINTDTKKLNNHTLRRRLSRWSNIENEAEIQRACLEIKLAYHHEHLKEIARASNEFKQALLHRQAFKV